MTMMRATLHVSQCTTREIISNEHGISPDSLRCAVTVYRCGRRGTIRPIRVGDRTLDRAELREWLLTQPRRAELDF